jgi:hypothetical protein
VYEGDKERMCMRETKRGCVRGRQRAGVSEGDKERGANDTERGCE